MKISVMREFVELSRTGNFTRTAEEMYIAQSALSRHMSALEEELGVRLMERDRNSFRLTSAGEITRDEFIRILNEYGRLLERLSQPDLQAGGELRMGFLYYDRDLYVAKIRAEFHHQYPNIHFTTSSCQPKELEDQLFSESIDVAILYGASFIHRNDVSAMPFLKIPFSLIFSSDHRLARVKEIRVEDLNGEKCIYPAQKFILNGTGKELSRMLSEHHTSFSQEVPVTNFDDVPWIMENTGAVYVSPMANPRAYGDSTRFQYLEPEKYSADISAVWLNDNDNPAIRRLLSVLRKCYP